MTDTSLLNHTNELVLTTGERAEVIRAALGGHVTPGPKALDLAEAVEQAVLNKLHQSGWQERLASAQHASAAAITILDNVRKALHLDGTEDTVAAAKDCYTQLGEQARRASELQRQRDVAIGQRDLAQRDRNQTLNSLKDIEAQNEHMRMIVRTVLWPTKELLGVDSREEIVEAVRKLLSQVKELNTNLEVASVRPVPDKLVPETAELQSLLAEAKNELEETKNQMRSCFHTRQQLADQLHKMTKERDALNDSNHKFVEAITSSLQLINRPMIIVNTTGGAGIDLDSLDTSDGEAIDLAQPRDKTFASESRVYTSKEFNTDYDGREAIMDFIKGHDGPVIVQKRFRRERAKPKDHIGEL